MSPKRNGWEGELGVRIGWRLEELREKNALLQCSCVAKSNNSVLPDFLFPSVPNMRCILVLAVKHPS